MKTLPILATLLLSAFLSPIFAQVGGYLNADDHKWLIMTGISTVEPIQRQGAYDLNQRMYDGEHAKNRSFCIGLSVLRNVKENFSMRLLSRLTEYNIDQYIDLREYTPYTAPNYDIDHTIGKSSMLFFAPGALWNFRYRIINAYGGFQVEYRKHNRVIIDRSDTWYDTTNTYRPDMSTTEHVTQGGGYSIGIAPLFGFYVNAGKTFSVGAEFSSSFSWYKLGGTVTNNFYNPVNAPPQSISGPAIEQGMQWGTFDASINFGFSF